MAYFGILFGLTAWLWCFSLSSEVRRLKRTVEDAGIGGNEVSSLREILARNIGETAVLRVERGPWNHYFVMKDCEIIEVDEEWVSLRAGKNGEEQLLRLRAIKSVNVR